MKLTIAEILDLPALARSTLLAGQRSLERPVVGVQLWDRSDGSTDVAEKLLLWPVCQGRQLHGELVCRTEAAASQQASALCLVLDPTIADARVSRATVEKLQALDLPVFRLACGEPSLGIIHLIQTQLLERVMNIVQRTNQIHRELSQVAIKGGDLDELTRTLAGLVRNPVGVRDLQFEVLSDATGGYGVDDARRRSIEEGRVSTDIRVALEAYDFGRRLRTERGPFRIPAIPSVGMRARVLAPILIGDVRYGYISIAECAHALGSLDLLAVEKGALVAALILSHQQALEKNERRLQASFAHELVFSTGDRDSAYMLDRRARLLGYGTEHFVVFAVGVGALDRLLADPLGDDRRASLLVDQLAIASAAVRPAPRRRPQPLVLTERDGVAVLYPVDPERALGDQRRVIAELKQFAAALVERIQRLVGEESIWVGIGLPRARQEVRKSYREARLALGTCRSLRDRTTYYGEMGLYRLLAESIDPQLLHCFAEELLGTLVRYDTERRGDLVRTLRLYLKCGGNKVKTAPLLPSHLNTVKYRLQQIADLTGRDPEDPEEQLCYRVALKILDLQD